ncbi:hypothetical protein EYC84_008105 [Monilinia fructicola]|uniref:NAD(P)H-hydrate epimerase n=1 Tax=Monilinia fructicola TaxID=38448 RepID=A0A5M9JII5_MONFR|nr:hypothetical protein EYC84_008105 [Monilinia fructicola]
MELAGLSVSQVVYKVHPPSKGRRILVACDLEITEGMQGKNELYQRLSAQLRNLSIPFTDDFPGALKESDHIVDAIFGFSFSGTLRDPFPSIITALSESSLPITSIDAPSSWDITNGPPTSGPGSSFMPQHLISLTAPKPLVKYFTGRHFLGGRFVTPEIAKKYNLQTPGIRGRSVDQIVEMPIEGLEEKIVMEYSQWCHGLEN